MVGCTDKEYRFGFTDRRCIGTVECTDRKCRVYRRGVRGWVYVVGCTDNRCTAKVYLQVG